MTVSLIIPIYNVSNFVERCLYSVLNQTYRNIEIVFVDDATPDNSMIKVRQILEKECFYNVKIISFSSNQGLSAARNTGVKNATGDYVYFLDSDDELPLTSIETLVSYITPDFQPDVVMGEMMIVGANRKKYSQLLLEEGTLLYDECVIKTFLCKQWYEMACNKLLKRSLFFEKSIWFYEGILHEDNLWSFNLAINTSIMIICRQYTYMYHIHPGTITSKKREKHFNSMIVIMNEMINLWLTHRINIDTSFFCDYLNNLKLYFVKTLLLSDCDKMYVKEKLLELNEVYNSKLFDSYHATLFVYIKNVIGALLIKYYTR